MIQGKMPAVFGALLDIIFPPLCPLCESALTDGPLCTGCTEGFGRSAITTPVCTICGTPFAGAVAEAGGGGTSTKNGEHGHTGHPCGECIKKAPPFSIAKSAYAYDGAILDAVHALKYQGRTSVAPALAELMYDSAKSSGLAADVVVPVPLHIRRLRSRGFNHSLLIARPLARMLGCRVDAVNLVRNRMTTPQVELSGAERRANVKGAFSVIDPSAFAGRRVLLVDDVYTTGATVRECSLPLLASDAEVSVLTLARAIKV